MRPSIEVLEDRLAPAAYTFQPPNNGVVGNWSNPDDWVGGAQNTIPGANDTATIPAGLTCTVDVTAGCGELDVSGTVAINHNMSVSSNLNQGLYGVLNIFSGGSVGVADNTTLSANDVTDAGALADNGTVDVTSNGLSGSGAVSVETGATMSLGSSNASASPSLDTISFSNAGTVALGGSSATGPTATLDADSASITSTGILNIGNPGSGAAGKMDVSKTMTNSGSMNVGGAGGSTGSLGAYVLTSSGVTIVNSKGEMDIDNSATLGGTNTVTGGVIKAENIDAFNGAGVTITGIATITSGPLSGNLVGEANASFTFASGSAVTLGAGATLGDGKFYIDGPLTVDTALDADNSEFVLQSDGSSSDGSIGGSGSIDWWNHEFDWQGGTIGGLSGGGFTIDGNCDFHTSGSDDKTLATTMTNFGDGTADFDGTGSLTITGPGIAAGAGALINQASAVLPMELSLPLVTGVAGDGETPGTFTNAGYLDIGGTNSVTLASPLNNTAAGVIDCETGAGPLTLSDTSGTSILDNKIGLNNDSLTISGTYTTDLGFQVEYSANDSTTLTGTLTIDSGASADFDHLILTAAPYGSGGTITGGGALTINDDGVNNGDYLKWLNGTIGGGGDLSIGPYATLYMSGIGTLGRNVDVHGTVECPSGGEFSCDSGTEIHVEKDGLFDFENSSGGYIPIFVNDGTLEVGAGDNLGIGTFTQSSTGTLQCNLAGDSSYGSLTVSGTATLDGKLDANLEGGYQPVSGTHFTVLKFGSSSGQFADVEPQGWDAEYDAGSVDLVSS